MNARSLISLTAVALVSTCLIAPASSQATQPATTAMAAGGIVDLPTITVRPSAEDLAFYRANRVVDLAAVTVRPAREDLAYFISSRKAGNLDVARETFSPAPQHAERGDAVQQVATR